MEGLNGVIFVEALHYFPFILLNLSASLVQHRFRDGGIGAESRRARLHAVPAHRVPAGAARLCRRRRAGVRQGVRRSRDAAAAQRHQHAGAAGLSEDHLGRHHRPDGLRDLGDHDRLLARRHGARRRWRCAAATSRPSSAAAAGSSRRALGPRRQRRRRPPSSCWSLLLVLSPHIGIFLLSIAHGVVVRRAARRLHARALRARSSARPGR